MGVKTVDPAVFQNENAVGILYAGNALGDNQFGGTRYPRCKRLSDFCVGGGVHGAGGIVKD